MAETLLTLADLNRIERDLDDQISPDPRTLRRLINDNRTLRKSATANASVIAALVAAAGRAHSTLGDALKKAGEVR